MEWQLRSEQRLVVPHLRVDIAQCLWQPQVVARVSIALWKVASGWPECQLSSGRWPDRPEGWTICTLSNAGLQTFPYKHINIKNIATQALLNIILEYHRWTVLASDNRDYLKDEICIKVTFLFPCHLIYLILNFSNLYGGGGLFSNNQTNC